MVKIENENSLEWPLGTHVQIILQRKRPNRIYIIIWNFIADIFIRIDARLIKAVWIDIRSAKWIRTEWEIVVEDTISSKVIFPVMTMMMTMTMVAAAATAEWPEQIVGLEKIFHGIFWYWHGKRIKRIVEYLVSSIIKQAMWLERKLIEWWLQRWHIAKYIAHPRMQEIQMAK